MRCVFFSFLTFYICWDRLQHQAWPWLGIEGGNREATVIKQSCRRRRDVREGRWAWKALTWYRCCTVIWMFAGCACGLAEGFSHPCSRGDVRLKPTEIISISSWVQQKHAVKCNISSQYTQRIEPKQRLNVHQRVVLKEEPCLCRVLLNLSPPPSLVIYSLSAPISPEWESRSFICSWLIENAGML